MTLATLKGMNFNIGDMANALKLKAADSVVSGVQRVSEKAASTAKTLSDAAGGVTGAKKGKAKAAPGVAGLVDPLQLWGSLTQQFQQIAASALRDAAKQTSLDVTKNMATGLAKEAIKSAAGVANAATKAAGKRVAGVAKRRSSSGVRKTPRGAA